MKIAVMGATGRTGRPLVATLLDRGHEVTALVRDPSKVAGSGITVVAGSSTDPDAMTALVAGADAVVSALGPTSKESDLHTQTAQILVDLLPAGARFVGISGAGIDVPGDQKGGRDKFVSKLLQTFGGGLAKDKATEYEVFAASDLEWTLARPPRLQDGAPTGSYYSDAHKPGRSTSLRRGDLATFLADCLEQHLFVRQAPFVSER